MAEHLLATESSQTLHSGSVFGGNVIGTLNPDALDLFVTIGDESAVSFLGVMDIPTHFFTLLLTHSHNFNPNQGPQDFVFIEDSLMATVGAEYTSDQTEIITSGNNDFVTIETG